MGLDWLLWSGREESDRHYTGEGAGLDHDANGVRQLGSVYLIKSDGCFSPFELRHSRDAASRARGFDEMTDGDEAGWRLPR